MLRDWIDSIKDWLAEIGFEELIREESWQVDSVILVLFITLLGSIASASWRLVKRWNRIKQQQRLKKDLHPYFSAADIRKATQYYVPTHFQSNPPSQQSELIQSHKVTARQKLMPFFLHTAFHQENDEQRFYIILAGSGMGKTTFMINLYMRYLRRKAINKAPFNIRLFPLGYPDILKKISEIPNPEKTILLLDGFDEDPQAIKNYIRRLNRILDKVRDFRVVVFTCRTQFFPSEVEEPRETGVVKFGSKHGFQTFAKMYLSPFNDTDISLFLKKKYGYFNNAKKNKALEIIDQSPNLMVRPMLLSYIDDLLQTSKKITYTSELYHEMIWKWIDREASRVLSDRRDDFREELYRFSREVALFIYQQRKQHNGFYVNQKEIKSFAERHNIKLDHIEMTSRSLLNRDVMGQYKFAHKSILEYFLAVEAIENSNFAARFSFEGMDQAEMFYDELCLSRHTLPFFQSLNAKAKLFLPANKALELEELSEKELKQIEFLELSDVEDIHAIRPLKKLRKLILNNSSVKDLSPLSNMPFLSELQLKHTQIRSLEALQNLLSLQKLYVDHTSISDLSPLRKLEGLTHIYLGHTSVRDLTPLVDMIDLTHLNIPHTQIKDLNPIRKHRALTHLSIQHSLISSLNPIRDLFALQHLNLGYTPVQNITPLKGMESLKFLSLQSTRINSMKPIGHLRKLRHLNLDQCETHDLSSLKSLSELQYFSLRQTSLSSIDTLGTYPKLKTLHLDQTRVNSLDGIQHFESLEEVSFRQTQISNLSPLTALPKLKSISFSKELIGENEIAALNEALPDCELIVG